MSSIYRKGRDGYFYYQTYVQNKTSGKKDKKIFHSLGTKNRIEAEKKKIYYDKKYGSKKNILNLFSKSVVNTRLLIIVALPVIIVFIYLSNSASSEPKLQFESPVKDNIAQDSFKAEVAQPPKDSMMTLELKYSGEKDSMLSQETIIDFDYPKFSIKRVDQLSSQFDQVQIFATVERNLEKERLLKLCKLIKNDYDRFANIVICLYSNSSIGVKLANGYDQDINLNEDRDAWLAFYTYNVVEGEFFDDKPSGYFGGK